MRSREFIKEVSFKRMIVQPVIDAVDGLVYILRHPNKGKDPSGNTIPGDTVQDPRTGQTLTYPTRDAAAEARKNMTDPSAIQGAIDAEKKAPNAMAAAQAGKLGSGSFVAKMPWKTDPVTGGVVQQIKDANGKIITKTYKSWTDYATQTGIYPHGDWGKGWLLAASKIFSTNIPIVKYFFTIGDLALFAKIMNGWRSDLNAIQESYTQGNYWQSDKKEAEANMQEVNEIYLDKLAKAVAITMTTNVAGGAYLFTSKAVKSAAAWKNISGSTAGDTLGSALAALFKTAGKTVNPETVKTLSTGSLESVKLFAAYLAANTDFKENIENALIRGFLQFAQWPVNISAWLLTALPIVGNLNPRIGTLSPADDDAMRKNAADSGRPVTPGAPPPGTPAKSTTDKLGDLLNKVNEP